MLAKRLPLLWAFAGGCVASGALVGFFREEASVPAEIARVRSAEAHREAAVANAVEQAPAASDVGGSAPKDAAADESSPKPDTGSSVADVLSRLEAAYRQSVAPAIADDEPAPPQAPTSVSDATPEPLPTHAGTPTTLVATVEAPQSAPKPDTPPEPAIPEAAAEPVVSAPVVSAPVAVARNDAPPRGISVFDVHVGDVHQNTQVGSVHQGDVYAVQQQLMVLQYLQLVAQSPHARLAAPAHDPRQVATRRPHAFSLPLTNPDNPWGFDFPPTVLVK